MEENLIGLIDNAHGVSKHRAMLKQCDYYIQVLSSQVVSEELFEEAYCFATDAYAEVQKDDITIALVNTSPIKRNVDIMTNLKINLGAIHKMLGELLAKESKDIARDFDECMYN